MRAAARGRASAPAFAAGSSTIASTTKLASASAAVSHVTFTLPLTSRADLLAQAADLGVSALGRAVGTRPYDYLAALRGHGREAACDGSGTGDSDSFGHGVLPVG